MSCIPENAIVVVKGNDTDFNGQNLLKLYLNTEFLDLSDLTATFKLCGVTKTFDDISSGVITINYSAVETASMPFGLQYGVLNLVSKTHKIATIESLIPFNFISVVHGDAIATRPFEMTINVEQGGENILNIDVQAAVSVEVGTTTTLPAGSDATVTNSGTASHLVLNFGIPRGENGEQGPEGPTGPEGPAGKDGADGSDAKINGVNTLTLNTSYGISLSQSGDTTTISGKEITDVVDGISALIPAQATEQNQLADKSFVNSSIATNTANFIGTFNSVAELEAYSGTVTNNDYAFVVSEDGEGNTVYDRYKYTTATTPASWEFEYELNNSSFTSNQWAAINSGATTTNISQITTNENAIGTLSSLTTSEKNNLVGAINELNSGKQANITGGASTITSSNLTANRALISNAQGKVDVSSVTNTELGYLSGATSSIQTQLNGKASTSLDNLSSAGQMIIDSQNGTISNCILDIPQDIKLELNNGTLTLKSGSIVTLPDGTQIQTTVDCVNPSWGSAVQGMIFLNTSNYSALYFTPMERLYSGPTQPSTTTNGAIWYDTTNSVMMVYSTSSNSWNIQNRSLPLCIITMTGSGATVASIDQVFDGFGYIGSTVFSLPGLRFLIPDGLKADGTYKSTLGSTSAIHLLNFVNNITGSRTLLMNYIGGIGVLFDLYPGMGGYNSITNYIYRGSGSAFTGQCEIGSVNLVSDTILSCEFRNIARLATKETTDKLQLQINVLDANKQDVSKIQTLSTTDSIALTDNTIYNGGEQTSLTITLPASVDVSFLSEIDFSSGSTATTLSYPQSGINWMGDDIFGGLFIPDTGKRYTIICSYNGVSYNFVVKGV